jgi:hypothetical protein
MATSVATFEAFPSQKMRESVRAVILLPSPLLRWHCFYSGILERRGMYGFRDEWSNKSKLASRQAHAIVSKSFL